MLLKLTHKVKIREFFGFSELCIGLNKDVAKFQAYLLPLIKFRITILD